MNDDHPLIRFINLSCWLPYRMRYWYLYHHDYPHSSPHLAHTKYSRASRPGRDTLHLVTIVAGELQRSAGQLLLQDYQQQAERSMVDVRADVVVRTLYALYVVC